MVSEMETFKKKLKSVKAKIDKYEKSELALTKTQLDNLWTQHHLLEKDIKKSCPHDHARFTRGWETDSGYGLDRTYYHHAIQCEDCGQHFQGYGTEYIYTDHEFETHPIIEIVKAHPNCFSDEHLEKMGISRHEKVTREVSFSRK